MPCSLPQASTSAGARVYKGGGYEVTPGMHVRESRTLPTQAHTHTHTHTPVMRCSMRSSSLYPMRSQQPPVGGRPPCDLP